MRKLIKILLCLVILGGGISESQAQITKMASKKISKGSLKTQAKKAIKVMSKGVLMEVPTGKESLKVIKHSDGSLRPAINNLNENATKFSEEFNRLLLKHRREAITENFQYLSVERLLSSKRSGNLVERSSASTLRKNLYSRMSSEEVSVAVAFGGTQAHHVVEGNAKSAAKSRAILKKFGIGINDAENGVLLRENDVTSIYKGTVHNTNHAEKYSDYVYSKIRNVKTQKELIQRLNEIKKALVSGTLDLEGNLKSSNAKFIF